MGNLGSLLNALDFLGAPSHVTDKPEDIIKAQKLILPGVGAFDLAMKNLQQLGLIPALNQAVLQQKTPILGICLGMQILASQGEENELTDGIGWIPGEVKKITLDSKYKVPHVGFNSVKINSDYLSLFQELPTDIDFYFVHSYQFICENENDISSQVYYGERPITASVQRDNIYGAQFHPEKSQRNGLLFLRNFLRL